MSSSSWNMIAILAAAAFIWWLVDLIFFKPWDIDLFYEVFFVKLLLKQPQLLSTLGLLERFGINGHNRKLTDSSDEFDREQIKMARNGLKMLRSYQRSSQNPAQLLSTDILDWFLDDNVRGEPFLLHNYPVNQMFGVQSDLPDFMLTIHRIETVRDARNYNIRLSKFGVKLGQVLDGVKNRERNGVIPPRFVIRRVQDEMTAFISVPAMDHTLYRNLQTKLEAIGASSEAKAGLLENCARQIEQVVYPAYQKLIDYFTELEPRATTDDGLWKLPNGDAYYAYLLRSNTTTDYTPQEVHDLGLREVERIEAEMRAILEEQGIHEPSISKVMRDLAKDPRFLYPNTDEGRARVLADYQAIIDEINSGLDPYFDLRPKVGVKVERIPEFREKTSADAYYMMPSMDGKRPGVFYANLRDLNELPQYGMRTLAYHEAIPGHHFQLTIAQGLKGLPNFRKVVPFTSYMEGWALYAEKFAYEHGFLKDPYSKLGYLQSELFRAVRLVVDTGIHYKRWTREEAIEYMDAHTGQPLPGIISEVERYIVMPGQACAYKIGELKIVELRGKMQAALGEKFELKQFHNVILRNGAMPLSLLEKQVDAEIARLA